MRSTLQSGVDSAWASDSLTGRRTFFKVYSIIYLMKRVMRIWAKISSILGILVLFFVIFSIYQSIQNLYNVNFLPSIVSSVIILIFYIPLFYFAWSKKDKSKIMKIFAKIVTILLPLDIIYSVLQNSYPNLYTISIVFISLIPLYYFGWSD